MKKIIVALLIVGIVTAIGFLFLKNKHKKSEQQSNTQAVQAAIVAQIANTQFSVTIEGDIIPSTSDGLTLLFLPQEASPQAGQKLEDAASKFAIKLAELLKKSDFHATSIRILSADNILAYDQKQTIAHFSAQKDAKNQVSTLQQVLAEARIGDDKIAKIDLRFENPVISEK